MLTRPVAAVKFDLSSTPEQAACSKKIDEGLKYVLETWSNTCSTLPTDVNRFIKSRRPFSGISW